MTRNVTAAGYLNINKPIGMTSAGVVGVVKRLTHARKVGHGGTLDPLATGVLPICIGAATRFADSILLGTKAYKVTVRLGTSTSTFDTEGETTQESDASHISEEHVLAVIGRFRGVITQVPPVYSAIKQKGRRLYDMARSGLVVQAEPRQVEVHRLELIRWNWPEFDLHLECGHGFYARSLANDIGKALGTASHMSALVRTQAGMFELNESITVADFESVATTGSWRDHLLPIDWTLQHLRSVELDKPAVRAVRNGQVIAIPHNSPSDAEFGPGEHIRAYDDSRAFIAELICTEDGLRLRSFRLAGTET